MSKLLFSSSRHGRQLERAFGSSPRAPASPAPGAAAVSCPGEPGSSGRNAFKGPRYFNTDLAFYKPFQIGDDNHLQIRGEIYNLFNKPHFGIPTTDISQSDFSKFTYTVGTPRMIQIALRYEF